MEFANANAFLLTLLLIPLAVAKILADAAARRRLRRVAGPRLLSRLRQGSWRGRDLLVFVLQMLALILLITAWARPQWGYTERESAGFGRSIIIALDTSKSMLAADLTPSRLTRARLAAQDLIAALPNDQIGLIAFAGRAFLQAPLTTDHEALLETLSLFDTELIPRGGTNLSAPIELAREVFRKSGSASHALILFSDGDELEGNAEIAARRAREENVTLVAVGVGTREGTLLPDPAGGPGFLRDESGRPVRSRLEERTLEQIARTTGGLYLTLGSTGGLRERVQTILAKLDRSRTQAQRETRQPKERYRWALIPGLLCLVAAYLVKIGRRLPAPRPHLPVRGGPQVAAALLLLAAAHAASAAPSPNPWNLYRQGDYESAAEGFAARLPGKGNLDRIAALEMGRGAAAYQLQDYDTAIEAFGQALVSPDPQLRAQAQYNLANSIAQQAMAIPKATRKRLTRMIEGVKWSIDHYDRALRLDPANDDARHNREEMEKLLEKLQQIKEQIQQEQQQQQEGGEQAEGQQGQQPSPGQQGQQGQPGSSGQSMQDEWGEREQDQGGGSEGEADGRQGGRPPGPRPGRQPEDDGQGEGGPAGDDRSEAPPEGDREARSGSQKREGEISARGGRQPGESPEPSAGTDEDGRRNEATGFSPSEARSLLRSLSDEDHVRPLERALPEGTYKDW